MVMFSGFLGIGGSAAASGNSAEGGTDSQSIGVSGQESERIS